jgi:hypothetical protein
MSDSKKSLTEAVLAAAAVTAGVGLGYAHVNKVELESMVEMALMFGPATVQGSLCMLKEGMKGMICGAITGAAAGYIMTKDENGIVGGAIAGTAIGATTTGFSGGLKGVVKGGLETAFGYLSIWGLYELENTYNLTDKIKTFYEGLF